MSGTKVLTVSYGRFSCTVEGYEDGIAALKEVTAHFRQLAEEDRLFGSDLPARLPPALPGPPALTDAAHPPAPSDEFDEPGVAATVHTPPVGADGPVGAVAKLALLRRIAAGLEDDWEEDEPIDAIAVETVRRVVPNGDGAPEPGPAEPMPEAGMAEDEAPREETALAEISEDETSGDASSADASSEDGPPRPAAAPEADEAESRAARIAAQADAVEAQLLKTVREKGRLGRGAETAPAKAVAAPEADETPEDDAPMPRAEDAPDPSDSDPAGRPRARARADVNEDAIVRLLGTANDKLHEADAYRRFDALRRLRHAVLATIADRGARQADREVPDNRRPEGRPYAEDLAQVVGSGRRSKPLVLEGAQRIDPDGAPGESADGGAPDGRADPSLDARMEAAARAAVRARGDGTFSRPEIMQAVDIDGETDSGRREEALRAFGTLLRTGRIVRAGQGLYALPDGPSSEASGSA